MPCASGVKEFTEHWGEVTPTTATTSTLDDVLDRLEIAHVDFLSMDIELAEPQALAGFSINRFTPSLVAVEAHPPVRQQILDYFARNNYVLIGRYWRADAHNFWFAPVGTTEGESEPLINDSHLSGDAVAHMIRTTPAGRPELTRCLRCDPRSTRRGGWIGDTSRQGVSRSSRHVFRVCRVDLEGLLQGSLWWLRRRRTATSRAEPTTLNDGIRGRY